MAIYRLRESGIDASTGRLARFFDVKEPSVIDVLRRLERKGLVKRRPWRGFALSNSGVILAERLIHNHRIVELFLSERLGIGRELACREASNIDYLLGDVVISRMCKSLGYPRLCFHGRPLNHKYCVKKG